MQRIRALQTPLQEMTLGSGVRLRTQTWPTYPSLLQTQTTFKLDGFIARAGDAQVNCNPARVFCIGTGATNSGQGRCSEFKAEKRMQ